MVDTVCSAIINEVALAKSRFFSGPVVVGGQLYNCIADYNSFHFSHTTFLNWLQGLKL